MVSTKNSKSVELIHFTIFLIENVVLCVYCEKTQNLLTKSSTRFVFQSKDFRRLNQNLIFLKLSFNDMCVYLHIFTVHKYFQN